MQKLLKHRWTQFIYKFVLPVFTLSLFVLWPSFDLALTGDDYLGLWRYELTLKGGMPGPTNSFRYFFIDYGPQDTATAIIHYFVGFQAQYYYTISFILRFLAALSFLPLIIYLTKNKKAALFSSLFFSVCSVGLETTDWSFNMPSYLAIALMNLFLISYFHYRKVGGISIGILSLILYLLTIVVQPIRIAFLPLLVISVELFGVVQRRSILELFSSSIRVVFYIGAFILLLKFTSIGMQAGGVANENGALGVFQQYTKDSVTLIQNRDYAKLFTPIAQLGSIIIPDSQYPKQFDSYSSRKFIFLILVPLFIGYLLFIRMLKKTLALENRIIVVGTLCTVALWNAVSLMVYQITMQYPLSNTQLLTTILGGYFLSTILFFIASLFKKEISLYLWTALLLIVLSYLIPWLRNPGALNTTVGRYLIVASAGLSLLIGLVTGQVPKKVPGLTAIFVLLFLLHLGASGTYLKNLSSARSRIATEKIRNTLALDKEADAAKTPSVYYFETDNPNQLYHTIIFGFPMFMYFYQDAKNPWNIAYTTSWKEVYDAHVDGTGLKRFIADTPPPVSIEHIYGYKLVSGELRDITAETRKKLLEETSTK